MGSDSSGSLGDHNSRICFLVKVRCGSNWDKQANELGAVHHRKGSWLGVVKKEETKSNGRESAGSEQAEGGVDF